MILLAPMEGVMDHSLRDVISRVGGIDRCVSEFIRITDQLLPARVFHRVMPELAHFSRTDAGVPVRAQLLGSDPACLADNAARLAELGAEGVDLNFGCPAKVVMRHRGGAVLLDEPELMHRIVREVRAAVPAAVPVSAKMRLGNHDEAGMLDAARALADGGAAEIVVHARTRVQGYRPPAHWHHIAAIRETVAATTPVIANGEVWTVDDARRCRAESGCASLMLGRGMVADPGLALAIRDPAAPPLPWDTIAPLLRHYWQRIAGHVAPRHRAGRLKQWLQQLKRTHPQAQALWDRLRTENDPRAVQALLFSEPSGA